MINYRVDNIVALVEELKKDNVTIVDECGILIPGMEARSAPWFITVFLS